MLEFSPKIHSDLFISALSIYIIHIAFWFYYLLSILLSLSSTFGKKGSREKSKTATMRDESLCVVTFVLFISHFHLVFFFFSATFSFSFEDFRKTKKNCFSSSFPSFLEHSFSAYDTILLLVFVSLLF